MPDKRGRGATFRVEFDDTTFTEDHAHSTPAGRDAALRKRAAVERDGQPADELITCDAEARDGTRLHVMLQDLCPLAHRTLGHDL